MNKLFLASKSPRRFEILKQAGFQFDIIDSSYEEELISKEFSYTKIETLAKNKAFGAVDNVSESGFILGADTVVVYENNILTKPKDYNDAFNMLKLLSGNTHSVVTSICILDFKTKKFVTHSTTTKVIFEQLSTEMIDEYIKTYNPYDKAGAYGIQEMPSGYIKTVEGDIENVIGLSSQAVKDTILKLETLL